MKRTGYVSPRTSTPTPFVLCPLMIRCDPMIGCATSAINVKAEEPYPYPYYIGFAVCHLVSANGENVIIHISWRQRLVFILRCDN